MVCYGRIACVFSIRSMSFNIGALCIALINDWLSLAGSRHRYTIPLVSDTMMKLLHHSGVSSTPSGTCISCSCSFSNFLNGCFSMYASCLGSAWYSFPSSLTFSEKVNF